MHRLMQGDVGAGKTVVALCALLTAVQGRFQGALMAPTEVLAEQHFHTMVTLLGDLSVPDEIEARRGAAVAGRVVVGGPGRSRPAQDLRRDSRPATSTSWSAPMPSSPRAWSTRALGVVVIDEQHRFGVEQRAVLRDRGPGSVLPDLLVMTATPIPRTAAMTVYGDLDVSVLDELPAGRLPVATSWARGPLEEAQVWAGGAGRGLRGPAGLCGVSLSSRSRRCSTFARSPRLMSALTGDRRRARLTCGSASCMAGSRAAEKEATMELFRSGDRWTYW